MPWKILERDDQFCVVKDDEAEETVACHDSRAKAEAQMRALYANVEASAPESLVFDLAGDDINFSVSEERRTIAGLLVPWNAAAVDNRGQGKWRFRKGSLYWNETGRVKLNTHHDHVTTIAYATHLQNIPTGVYGKFKVARGEEGDRALRQAQDGILDAFSIEVDPTDAVWEFDRSERSVRNVSRARLVAAALVPVPAFDDARVELIAASAYRGNSMEQDKDPREQVEEEDPTVKFDQHMASLAEKITTSHQELTTELTQSVGESISAGFRAALENISDPQGPETVKAARYATLKEPSVYQFNGAGHSLVRDAWNAARNQDDDAIDRLRKFRKQSEDVAALVKSQISFAPQTTTTAAQIIPPGYRPDLYVADLFRERPLVGLASQGTISNASPFTVPVFTSVTTGSATHVEGTNPSDGSLAFDTKTVTPQAISGRIVLSRELVDSSNPAIDQIAFAEMRESYARQTEAIVYTLLNGTSGAGGTITSGFVPSGAQASTTAKGTDQQTLVKHLRQRVADYFFARFASITGAAMGQTATQNLVTAVDTTQRPLFPYIGPNNAVGTANAAEGAYLVDGVSFQPAWAMTGVAAGDSQIFLVNRRDLWVWESPLLNFRFEEKQGPANIELNIFGYFATHLLRPVGLSGIRIT
jgi:HK97 family phage prohead protease/HK97 family phage major capsid protein